MMWHNNHKEIHPNDFEYRPFERFKRVLTLGLSILFVVQHLLYAFNNCEDGDISTCIPDFYKAQPKDIG
jgi:hypothetical protein